MRNRFICACLRLNLRALTPGSPRSRSRARRAPRQFVVFWIAHFRVRVMADAPAKKRGRPATGRDPLISARIPQEAIDALDAMAARDEETRSKLVRRAILEWLESQRR